MNESKENEEKRDLADDDDGGGGGCEDYEVNQYPVCSGKPKFSIKNTNNRGKKKKKKNFLLSLRDRKQDLNFLRIFRSKSIAFHQLIFY